MGGGSKKKGETNEKEIQKILDAVPGQYVKKKDFVVEGQPVWQPKKRKEKTGTGAANAKGEKAAGEEVAAPEQVNILWNPSRRQWQHRVGETLLFVHDDEAEPPMPPFGIGRTWRVAPSCPLLGKVAGGNLAPPTYAKRAVIEKKL